MSHIGQIIEFTSDKFPPCPKDEELCNHDTMHGFLLASYIAERLPAKGFTVNQLIAEDWGWLVCLVNGDYSLELGCCSYERSYDFVVFTKPDRPIIRKWLRKIDVSERVDALNTAVFEILRDSAAAIKGPTWVG